jgi:hypothetical protein
MQTKETFSEWTVSVFKKKNDKDDKNSFDKWTYLVAQV